MAVWVFYASLFHSFLEHGIFWNPDISQCSVATCARCGGISNNHLIANFLEICQWKNLLKTIKVWWSYCHEFDVSPFRDTVYRPSGNWYFDAKKTQSHSNIFKITSLKYRKLRLQKHRSKSSLAASASSFFNFLFLKLQFMRIKMYILLPQ